MNAIPENHWDVICAVLKMPEFKPSEMPVGRTIGYALMGDCARGSSLREENRREYKRIEEKRREKKREREEEEKKRERERER
jgi:hypothetical protein